MQFFRSFVIGTLSFVAFIVFILTILLGVFAGMQPGFVEQLRLPFDLPDNAVVGAVIGGVAAWLSATVALGLLFVLIDIQDGIRDLHRALAKKDGGANA